MITIQYDNLSICSTLLLSPICYPNLATCFSYNTIIELLLNPFHMRFNTDSIELFDIFVNRISCYMNRGVESG